MKDNMNEKTPVRTITDDSELLAKDASAFSAAENAAMRAQAVTYLPRARAVDVVADDSALQSAVMRGWNGLWKALKTECEVNHGLPLHEKIMAAIGNNVYHAAAEYAPVARDWGVTTTDGTAEITRRVSKWRLVFDGPDGQTDATAALRAALGAYAFLPLYETSLKTIKTVEYRLRRLARGKSFTEVLEMERAFRNAQKSRDEMAAKVARLEKELAAARDAVNSVNNAE